MVQHPNVLATDIVGLLFSGVARAGLRPLLELLTDVGAEIAKRRLIPFPQGSLCLGRDAGTQRRERPSKAAGVGSPLGDSLRILPVIANRLGDFRKITDPS